MSRKVLYVHDGSIYKTNSGKMYSMQFTEKVKQRYLKLGDSITCCLREKKITENESKRFSEISESNFTFVPFPNFKSLRSYIPNKAKAKVIIGREIENHDLAIIRMPSAAGAIAIKAARKNNVPYLVEMVSCAYDALWHYDWRGKLLAYYKLKKNQYLIKDCPYVIYVTQDYLQSKYPTSGFSLSCSDVELSSSSETHLHDRLEKIKKQKGPLNIGSIGVLDVKYKGQADVIRALHKLKKEKGIIYHYKIVGQRDSSHLQNLIKKLGMQNEIEIIGPLPPTKINEFLNSIDIFIQPSKTEGLPRALVEALNMACPSLGSRVGGIPELIDKDCLFEAGNMNEIIGVLQSFSKEKMKEKATRNFEKSLEYQQNILEKKRNDFYSTFLKNNNFH